MVRIKTRLHGEVEVTKKIILNKETPQDDLDLIAGPGTKLEDLLKESPNATICYQYMRDDPVYQKNLNQWKEKNSTYSGRDNYIEMAVWANKNNVDPPERLEPDAVKKMPTYVLDTEDNFMNEIISGGKKKENFKRTSGGRTRGTCKRTRGAGGRTRGGRTRGGRTRDTG